MISQQGAGIPFVPAPLDPESRGRRSSAGRGFGSRARPSSEPAWSARHKRARQYGVLVYQQLVVVAWGGKKIGPVQMCAS